MSGHDAKSTWRCGPDMVLQETVDSMPDGPESVPVHEIMALSVSAG